MRLIEISVAVWGRLCVCLRGRSSHYARAHSSLLKAQQNVKHPGHAIVSTACAMAKTSKVNSW
jgi:hypothetical protein